MESQKHRPTAQIDPVPDDLESAQAKLVYIYLEAADGATVEELGDTGDEEDRHSERAELAFECRLRHPDGRDVRRRELIDESRRLGRRDRRSFCRRVVRNWMQRIGVRRAETRRLQGGWLERLEVAVELPLGDVDEVVLELLFFGFDELRPDVLAEGAVDNFVLLEPRRLRRGSSAVCRCRTLRASVRRTRRCSRGPDPDSRGRVRPRRDRRG